MPRKKQLTAEKPMPGFYESNVTEMPEETPALEAADLSTEGGDLVIDLTDEFNPDTEGEEYEGTPEDFAANLAEMLTESERTTLGDQLKEFVEVDLQSRSKWEERLIEGLEIIGLEDIPDDATMFEMAARANYPGIAEAMVQFQARSAEELLPPEGPVKGSVIGKPTEQLVDRAERVEAYMNYQLTEEDDEYYAETDGLLMYLPFAGSAFRKVAPDPLTGRTRARFVTAADFIVPSWAKSLKTAPRYTHRYSTSLNDYLRAVKEGYYSFYDFDSAQPMPNRDGQKLADVSDDRQESYHEDDRDLQFYEITIDWEFEWEDKGPADEDSDSEGGALDAATAKKRRVKLPYVITFEWETGAVVRIARCWDEADPTCTRDVWFTHYKFLPGFGFYGWGYLHIIGGLGKAASGAIRLMLDASASSSISGGFKSRDARVAGNMTFSPGEWVDVDMSAEELAKSFYSPEVKSPTPALFQTLDLLVNSMQRFMGTTEAVVGDAKNTGPVGTTVALIEQGSKMFSGIHKRLHAAQRIEFKQIATCNFRYMSEEQYEFASRAGNLLIRREDFSPEIDVAPVGDPNIYSSVQRIALAQAVTAAMAERPDLFTRKASVKAYRQLFRALKVPDADDYFEGADEQRCDPVTENEKIVTGAPVAVYREQDDASHLMIHTAFLQELAGYPPEVQKRAAMALQAHIAAHQVQAYRKRVEMAMIQASGIPLPPYDPNGEDHEELPPEIENQVAKIVAGLPAIAPPPPPPPQQTPEDQAFAAEEKRKQQAFEAEERRKDEAQAAQLKRDGMIPDIEQVPM